MAKLNAAKFTNAGLSAAADLFQHKTLNKVSKISISSTDYTNKDVSGLNKLTNEALVVLPSAIKKSANVFTVTGVFDSSRITTDTYIRAIGVYINDISNNEVLLAVVTASVPDFIPAGGNAQGSIVYDINIAVNNIDVGFELTIDDNAIAQMSDIKKTKDYVDQQNELYDSKAVHKSGNELIDGVKSFSQIILGSISGHSNTADYVSGQELQASDDLSLIKTSGRYFTGATAGSTVLNKPNGASNWFTLDVFVQPGGQYGMRSMVDSNGRYFFSGMSGGDWLAWSEINLNTGSNNWTGKNSFSEPIVASGGLVGNASTADKLKKTFNLSLSGEGTGNVSIDGSGNVSLPLTLPGVVHKSGAETIEGTKTFTAGPVISQDAPGLWFGTTGSPDGNQQLIRLGSTGTMGENIGYFGTNQLALFGGGEGAGAIQKDIYTNGKAKGDLSFLDSTTESAALVGDGSVFIITHANNYQNGTYSGHNVIEFSSGGDILINGKSYDADSVHKSGNETVGGDKNFTGTMPGTTKINQILTALNGNSVVSLRPDIQAYEYSGKGLTFRFIKIGPLAFVNVSGNVSEDITSEETLFSFGSSTNAKIYAQPYWAGGETTGYKGPAISLGQAGVLSIWDDGTTKISYRGPKIAKGAWMDGSITYISNAALPANMIANNS